MPAQCAALAPFHCLRWKHLVTVLFPKGFDQSLLVYPAHENIPPSRAIGCGFVLSLGNYLGPGSLGSVWGTPETLQCTGASGDLCLPPVSLL